MKAIAVVVAAAAGLILLMSCQLLEQPDPGRQVGADTSKLSPNMKSINSYLKLDGRPDEYTYLKWKLFPGTVEMRRLGLPVHGRWVTTYVNDTAFDYIKGAIDHPDQYPEPLDLPTGSMIVKENYRTALGIATITTIDPKESQLKVLTIMFKPDPAYGYCATPVTTNGSACYGGEWFYGFHMFAKPPPPPLSKNVAALMNKNVNNHVPSFCVNCHAPAYRTDYVRTLGAIRDPFSEGEPAQYCDQFTASIPPQPAKKAPSAELASVVQQQDLFCEAPVPDLDPVIPPDVPVDPWVVSQNYGSKLAQRMFDCLAWKTFIALNWQNLPPDPTTKKPRRGQPDTSRPFSAPRTGPTVWETYKPTFEIFQPNLVDWDPSKQPWDQPQAVPVCKSGQSGADRLALTMSSKTRDVVNETGQAFAGTFGYLVDRNNKRVRYEVLVNRTEFEYLIADGRAATKLLTPSGPQTGGTLLPITFPDNKTDKKHGVGAIEMKSAWKELWLGSERGADAPSLEAAKKKFYVRRLTIYDEVTGACSTADMALIGLHIAHKTHWAPQWIWITFEHESNVPPFGRTDVDATFFDSSPSHKAPAKCWQLPFLAPLEATMFCPNVDLNRFKTPDQPNQLTRLVEIEPEARYVNKKYQAVLKERGSPFANYVLVSAQWPLNGRNVAGEVNAKNCANNQVSPDRSCFTMFPRFLRNTVIESYMSTYCTVDGQNRQFSNRSCMGCHGTAGTDLSYIWLDAVSQRVPIEAANK